jgi:hypothetical protein
MKKTVPQIKVGPPATAMPWDLGGTNKEPLPKTKTTILADAAATIAGPREQEYGSKLQNFTQIAMMVQGYLAPKLLPDSRITPEDIAMIMIIVKMARLAKSPDHKDSILDVAGYAGCFDELQLQRAAEVPLLGATVDPRSKS